MEKTKDFIIPYDISVLKEEDIPENIIISNFDTKIVKYGKYNPTEDFINEASDSLSFSIKQILKKFFKEEKVWNKQ